jgi:hypothetical protein
MDAVYIATDNGKLYAYNLIENDQLFKLVMVQGPILDFQVSGNFIYALGEDVISVRKNIHPFDEVF